MSDIRLGRLVRGEVKKSWGAEDRDFTPWLALDENLNELATALNLGELIDPRTEVAVGDFRLDILTEDSETGAVVAIENQFGVSDHRHLGQLLTYAAGVSSGQTTPKVFVWIAEKIREEHRSALDWLNQTTPPEVGFFGVELEVWKIVDSDGLRESTPAPRFNVISRPNDFQKTLGQSAVPSASEAGTRYLEFWTQFADRCANSKSPLRLASPKPVYWLQSAIGVPNFNVNFTASSRDRCAGCELYISGKRAKAFFKRLANEEPEIRKQIGDGARFEALPDRLACKIVETVPFEIRNLDDWPRILEWLRNRGETFLQAFTERARVLNADRSLAESVIDEGELSA